ncbi:MAG: MBL fold metallo-hydrolase [Mucilaginibacter polytrichastri]|nr:MBL fold metallo-hydrolase [Mucilaginibacter polytrichastri]
MKLHVIDTGLFKLDGGAMFGVVPKAIWNKTNPADGNNMCTWAMRCLLVETDGRRILIDTGIGTKQDEKFLSRYYMHGQGELFSSLKKAGFSAEDITDVFLTHLHFDHVGGAVIREGDTLLPAFPNALYWTNERHWKWAIEPNAREKASFLKENLLPLQESGRLRFIDVAGEAVFTPDFRVRFAYGHTDAMMIPLLNYGNRTVAYMADLLPSVGHIPLPYVMAYDMFPMKTLEEKSRFLQEAAEKNYILFLEHDPVYTCCTVHSTEKGIRLERTFELSSLHQ